MRQTGCFVFAYMYLLSIINSFAGNKGAPINDIARIWFDSLLEFIENRRETSNLKEVHFVNKDSACLKAVQGQLEAYVAKAETALY